MIPYCQSPLIRDDVFFTLLQVPCLENCTKINNCHIELTLQWQGDCLNAEEKFAYPENIKSYLVIFAHAMIYTNFLIIHNQLCWILNKYEKCQHLACYSFIIAEKFTG